MNLNLIKKFLEQLKQLSSEERRDIFTFAEKTFCRGCGVEQDEDKPCRCWRDE